MVTMRRRSVLVGLVVAAAAVGCAGDPPVAGDARTATSAPSEPGFVVPPSSEVLTRALRTDVCALLDEAAVSRLGWSGGSPAETLTGCAAASPDLSRSVELALEISLTDVPSPADGDRCVRSTIVDPDTKVQVRAKVRVEPDPCGTAERFLTTAVARFQAGAGTVEPPNPWIAFDACQVLAALLPATAAELGPAKQTLREVRRLDLRDCIANHERGEVQLSVVPAAGRAADLEGDEVAIAARPARQRELSRTCIVQLVGDELAGGTADRPRGSRKTQVITIEVTSDEVDAPRRCAAATTLAENLVQSW